MENDPNHTSETCFIPLYGRALMSRENKIIRDPAAEEIIKKCGCDFSRLRIPRKIQIFMSLRASLMDQYCISFIAEHPGCTVVSLGCGLDSRFSRIDDGKVRWYDLDLPGVIELKTKYFDECDRYHFIPSSVMDFKWIDGIPKTDGPILIIAEGLLMYLSPGDVKSLFMRLQERLKAPVVIFDAYSRMTARFASYQRSLRESGAKIRWGFDDIREIEAFGSGIIHMKTLYLADHPGIKELSPYFRIMSRELSEHGRKN